MIGGDLFQLAFSLVDTATSRCHLGYRQDPPYFPTSQFSLVPRVLGASLPIAVVSILIDIGLGSMFAEKHGYKVLIFTIVFPDQSSQFIKINCIQVPPNTECIAQEVSNLVGTFFLCLLMSASLCRSLVQWRHYPGCRWVTVVLIRAVIRDT